MMYRKVYSSQATHPIDGQVIQEILSVSRRNNGRDGLTGMLMVHEGKFLQVLEGPLDKMEACYQRIQSDPRHLRVRILSHEMVNERLFKDWRMGLSNPDDLGVQSREAAFSLYDLVGNAGGAAGQDTQAERLVRSFLLQFGLRKAAVGDLPADASRL